MVLNVSVSFLSARTLVGLVIGYNIETRVMKASVKLSYSAFLCEVFCLSSEDGRQNKKKGHDKGQKNLNACYWGTAVCKG